MSITKKFNSSKFLNHKVFVRYDVDRHIIRIICLKKDVAAKYIAKLILEKKVGAIDSVIYSGSPKSDIVVLLRGEYLNKFLRSGQQPITPPRKKFSEFADTIA